MKKCRFILRFYFQESWGITQMHMHTKSNEELFSFSQAIFIGIKNQILFNKYRGIPPCTKPSWKVGGKEEKKYWKIVLSF